MLFRCCAILHAYIRQQVHSSMIRIFVCISMVSSSNPQMTHPSSLLVPNFHLKKQCIHNHPKTIVLYSLLYTKASHIQMNESPLAQSKKSKKKPGNLWVQPPTHMMIQCAGKTNALHNWIGGVNECSEN